jgi:DNA polymerase III alpha subunit
MEILSSYGKNVTAGDVLVCITEACFCDVTDEASEVLKRQTSERHENHKQLLEDLNTILEQVSLIWQRIGKAYAHSFKNFQIPATDYHSSLSLRQMISYQPPTLLP